MHRQRYAKIVATLGPTSSDPATIRALFDAGVDVFRLNFSHGTHADHQARVEAIRRVERDVVCRGDTAVTAAEHGGERSVIEERHRHRGREAAGDRARDDHPALAGEVSAVLGGRRSSHGDVNLLRLGRHEPL